MLDTKKKNPKYRTNQLSNRVSPFLNSLVLYDLRWYVHSIANIRSLWKIENNICQWRLATILISGACSVVADTRA